MSNRSYREISRAWVGVWGFGEESMENGNDDRAVYRGCIGIRFHSHFQLI